MFSNMFFKIIAEHKKTHRLSRIASDSMLYKVAQKEGSFDSSLNRRAVRIGMHSYASSLLTSGYDAKQVRLFKFLNFNHFRIFFKKMIKLKLIAENNSSLSG